MILLVVGIDGIGLLDAERYGLMAALGERYRWGKTDTPGYTLPSVSSFLTGLEPEVHGITPMGHRDRPGWEGVMTLRSHKTWLPKALQPFRLGLCGVPCTYPPEPLNGWVVGGILAPGGAVSVWPYEYAREIEYVGMCPAKVDLCMESDRRIASNAIKMQDRLPVDVLVVYFSGWNRMFGQKATRELLMENLISNIKRLPVDGPTLVWSDHGNDDGTVANPDGTLKEVSVHAHAGLVATNLEGRTLPTTIPEIHQFIVETCRGAEAAIWDRITERHRS